MLKNLPIISSQTLQIFYSLFLIYSHIITYYPLLFYCVTDNNGAVSLCKQSMLADHEASEILKLEEAVVDAGESTYIALIHTWIHKIIIFLHTLLTYMFMTIVVFNNNIFEII